MHICAPSLHQIHTSQGTIWTHSECVLGNLAVSGQMSEHCCLPGLTCQQLQHPVLLGCAGHGVVSRLCHGKSAPHAGPDDWHCGRSCQEQPRYGAGSQHPPQLLPVRALHIYGGLPSTALPLITGSPYDMSTLSVPSPTVRQAAEMFPTLCRILQVCSICGLTLHGSLPAH